jgi:beta-lactamase regulating signal transducer with metallopeptidase domain
VSTYPTYQFWLELGLRLGLGAGAIILLTVLATQLFRSASARRLIWQACLVGFGLLFLSEVSGAAGGMMHWMIGESPAPVRYESQPLPHSFAAIDESPVTRPSPEPVADSLPTALMNFPVQTICPAPHQPPADQSVWWPGVIWFLVMMVFLIRILLSRLLLVLYRRRHHVPVTGPPAECLGSLAGRMGIRRPLCLIESAGLTGPVAFGILRPTIALPERFADFTAEQQDAIVAHELMHVANHDSFWMLLANLVAAVWWWHPLVWWARQKFQTACELVADEGSLVVPDGPRLLAECLVILGKRQPDQMAWLAMTGTGFRSGLGRRVQRLMRIENRTWQSPKRLSFALALVLMPSVFLAGALSSTALTGPHIFAKGDWNMKPFPQTWKRSLAGILVTAMFGWSTSGGLADDQSAPPGEKPRVERPGDEKTPTGGVPANPGARPTGARPGGTAPPGAVRPGGPGPRGGGGEIIFAEQPTPRIKVFRLKHRDPDELRQILEGHFDSPAGKPDASSAGPAGPEGRLGPGGGGEGRGIPLGPGGATAPRFPQYGPGGLSGGPGGGGSMESPRLVNGSVAVDKRTHSLIIRGTDRDLQIAADLVAVLDLEKDKPVPKVESLRAFNLRHARAKDIADVLRNLNLNAAFAFPPKSNLVIVIGSEAEMKEIGEVIDALDVEVKP